MKLRGYIQAGGGSTRLGKDKALIEFNGKSMLARTTELLGTVCDRVKLVAVAGRYIDAPAEILADRWPGEGPLGGILTALLDSQREEPELTWNLIVSCDMPFLTSPWLRFLCERASLSKAQVVVPQSANGLEPLCACWRSDGAKPLEGIFHSGTRKVTQAMKQLPREVLDEAAWKRFDTDGRLFWNMNTEADYEEARRILESHQA